MKHSEHFTPDPDGARRSRRFVLAHLDGVPAETVAAVALLTSELASNAVRHAGTEFTVSVEKLQNLIRVEVTDGASTRPTLRFPPPAEPTGRGLQIVETLADMWGTELGEDSKTTWFVFNTSPAAEPDAEGAVDAEQAAASSETDAAKRRDPGRSQRTAVIRNPFRPIVPRPPAWARQASLATIGIALHPELPSIAAQAP